MPCDYGLEYNIEQTPIISNPINERRIPAQYSNNVEMSQ
jgi:hypothetical protein